VLSSLTPRQWRIIVALLLVLAVVLIALIALQLSGSEDSTAPTTLGPSSSPPTSVTSTTLPRTTTTSEAATTSTLEETTSTSEAVTTTVAETTTTSGATTTTVIASGLVLEADGLEAVDFGQGPSIVISTVTATLGAEPDADTGWLDAFDNPYGTCPSPEVRGVEWGILVLLFTSAETDFAPAGTRHFFTYSYAPLPSKPGAGPHGLETSEGIGLGSTTKQVQDAYGDRVEIIEDEVFGPFFAVDLDFESDTALGGTLTSSNPTGKVASVLGGVGCGE